MYKKNKIRQKKERDKVKSMMMKEEKTNLEKYPKQIAQAEIRNVSGKQATFTIDQELYLPQEGDSPMKMYADYSRFVAAIIVNQNGEIKNPNANILPKEIPAMYEKTKFCNWKYWENEMQPQQQEQGNTASPAFSVRLAGKFSGKTAVQILLEKGENGKKMLLEQKAWLSNNLNGRYAKANKEQIDAIDEAIHLSDNGKLKNENIRATQILINEPVKKYFRKTKVIDGKEYNKCYEIQITFELGRQYPYTVKIRNSYCSVRKDNNTGKTLIGGENLEMAVGEIRLTVGQWTYYIDTMRSRMQEHSFSHYEKQERIMLDNVWKPEPATTKYTNI